MNDNDDDAGNDGDDDDDDEDLFLWYYYDEDGDDEGGAESGSPGRQPDLQDEGNSHMASVMVTGSPFCGKTSLLEALAYNRYTGEYRETSIAQYTIKCDYVDPVEEFVASSSQVSAAKRNGRVNKKMDRLQNVKVDLSLIDISGAKDHATERQVHCKNADIMVFVYDVTKRESLIDVRDYYYREVCRMKNQNPLDLPHILVGTKLDLYNKVGREGAHVTEEESSDLAGIMECCWSIRTSAREGTGLEDLKNYLLSFAVANTPRESGVHDEPPPAKRRKFRSFGIGKKSRCVLQ